MPMRCDLITLFPEMVLPVLGQSILKRALLRHDHPRSLEHGRELALEELAVDERGGRQALGARDVVVDVAALSRQHRARA